MLLTKLNKMNSQKRQFKEFWISQYRMKGMQVEMKTRNFFK